jgi:hypothetical protein
MTSSIIKNMAKVRGRYNSNNHDALDATRFILVLSVLVMLFSYNAGIRLGDEECYIASVFTSIKPLLAHRRCSFFP